MSQANADSRRGRTGFDIDALLDVSRRRLGMEVAWLSSFRSDLQVLDIISGDALGLCAGDASDLDGSYCARVLDGRLPNIVHDARSHPVTRELAITHQLGIGSYIGVPVYAATDAPVGMLCCVSSTTAEHLSQADVRTLETMADIVGEMITRGEDFVRRATIRQRTVDEILGDLNGGRLRMVFQPIVSPIDAGIVGVEALCRIDGSSRRIDEWFREATSVGLGIEAELAAVAAALSELPKLPEPLTMSLNASPDTIADPRLAELISGSSPERLVVEITEHQEIEDYSGFGAWLEPLRSLGVRIAVDDVGAGFATFSHVLELRPDVLKLDRSIVSGIDADLARQAIASAVVDLGRRIDAVVVAEGVETIDEMNTAVAVGLEIAQGFLFCRPAALADSLAAVGDVAVGLDGALGLEPTAGQLARRFDLAMQHSPVGMALVTLDGTLHEVNAALGEMLGVAVSELRGSASARFVHPDDREADPMAVAAHVDHQRESCRVERRYVRSDGHVVATETTVVLVRSELGRPLYYITQVLPRPDTP